MEGNLIPAELFGNFFWRLGVFFDENNWRLVYDQGSFRYENRDFTFFDSFLYSALRRQREEPWVVSTPARGREKYRAFPC